MRKQVIFWIVLLTAICASARPALAEGFVADRWGRYPVNIYINSHSDVYLFPALGVSIEELRGDHIEAAVTPDKLKELVAAGWRVEPRIEKPISPDIIQAYHNYAWLTAKLDSVHAQYPGLTKKVSIGTSVQGRQLWAFLVSDYPDSSENEAEVRFAANIHGNEPEGVELCIGMIDSLTQCYGTVPEITDLVNNREIWFVPMFNPDGNTSQQRYNANGVDLNRNYPIPNGTIPTAEVETQHMMAWENGKRLVAGCMYHSGAQIVNYQWDYADSITAPLPDSRMINQVSIGYSSLNSTIYNSPNPSFPYGVVFGWYWYPAPGSLQDWSYHVNSCVDLTIEISNTQTPPASQLPQLWADNREAMLYLIRQAGWGVQGVVTDSLSGAPLNRVQVSVSGTGKPVYTDSLAGDYHRMLMTGYYSLTFTKSGYAPKTFANVRIRLDSLTNLDAALSPLAPGALSGTVRDSASGDPISGAVVSLSGSGTDTTDTSGQYSIQTYQGYQTVTASAAGYLAKVIGSVLVGGATSLDIDLAFLHSYNYAAHDTINIPDNGAWIEDSLYVDRELTLADYEIYVNITHPYIGDLAVRVFAPSGDSLRLHQRSGGSADDIVGWYDSELVPADLARWTALVGQNSLGFWRLRARDFASIDTGRLNGWGLQLFSTDTGVNGGPAMPGTAPRLFLSCRPNPFASGTVMAYCQPGPGQQSVELAVYNVAGQRVHTLVNSIQSPAKYLMEWNGRDGQDRNLAAGVYLVRLAVGKETAFRRLVLVR